MTRIRTLIRSLRMRLSPALIALGVLALLVIAAPVPVYAAPVERTIRVEAGNYAFDPGTIRVNPGDRVTIELAAMDVAHGLSIDGYPVDLRAEPGQTTRATFTADRRGTFKLRCSIACGNLHPFMTGKFEVGPNLLLLRAAVLSVLVVIAGVIGGKRG